MPIERPVCPSPKGHTAHVSERYGPKPILRQQRVKSAFVDRCMKYCLSTVDKVEFKNINAICMHACAIFADKMSTEL